MKKILSLLAVMLLLVAMPCTASAQRHHHKLHIVTTGDVHGAWFREPFADGGRLRNSLACVKVYVDSLRNAVGKENVLFFDLGDCIQGSKAAYYADYVADTTQPHLFSRIAKYMGYDDIVVGNHDLETGHSVYDRVFMELAESGIFLLAANFLVNGTDVSYFFPYDVYTWEGMKVLVMGFGNSNIRNWLPERLWNGIDFEPLPSFVQKSLDEMKKKVHPDLVIVLAHTGTGEGDGTAPEAQGMDLFNSLKGVDLMVGAHDHRPFVMSSTGMTYMDGGSHADHFAHAVIDVTQKNHKIKEKRIYAENISCRPTWYDKEMEEEFRADFEAIKEFSAKKVGRLEMDLHTRDAYRGQSDYLNLLHTVMLERPDVKISIASPLTFDGSVYGGDFDFNGMFTLYPFENELYVLNLKGSELKSMMEYVYERVVVPLGEHALRIIHEPDLRNNLGEWSFEYPFYHYDSYGGIKYTVDLTRPEGERITIQCLADGTPFEMDAYYPVAMTSFRASGGGHTITEGTGLTSEEVAARVINKYPDIRNLIYDYFVEHQSVTHELISDESVVGSWKYVPEELVDPVIENDLRLIFGD